MDNATTLENARRMYEAGAPIDAIIKMMRNEGTSKVMSIRVLAELGVPLVDAKILVHESPVWSDVKVEHEQFAESLERALDQLRKGRGPKDV